MVISSRLFFFPYCYNIVSNKKVINYAIRENNFNTKHRFQVLQQFINIKHYAALESS